MHAVMTVVDEGMRNGKIMCAKSSWDSFAEKEKKNHKQKKNYKTDKQDYLLFNGHRKKSNGRTLTQSYTLNYV